MEAQCLTQMLEPGLTIDSEKKKRVPGKKVNSHYISDSVVRILLSPRCARSKWRVSSSNLILLFSNVSSSSSSFFFFFLPFSFFFFIPRFPFPREFVDCVKCYTSQVGTCGASCKQEVGSLSACRSYPNGLLVGFNCCQDIASLDQIVFEEG